jgi:hypothetical protein
MAKIISLGCQVADVHHRYHEIHGALFGASSFRLAIDALRGKRRFTYAELARPLDELKDELAALEVKIEEPEQSAPAAGSDDRLQVVLLDYTRALSSAVVSLENICLSLERDEEAYREMKPSGGSRFNRDKRDYDQLLSRLERLGTKLNRLFASY